LSFTLRRIAGTAALVVAASGLTLPLATPAEAVVLPDRVWQVYDADNDDAYGLYYSDGPTGTKHAAPGDGETAVTNVSSLAASADGSRVIYMRYTYLPSIDDVKQEVVVRDTSSQVVRVLESKLISTGVYPDVPALSPNGSEAVWESYDDTTSLYSVRKALVGSGGPSTLVGGDLTPYAFLSNDTVLIQTPDGVAYTIPFAGGATSAVTGLPENAIHVTVSPDGTKLAWPLVTSQAAPFRSKLQIATVTLNSGVATVGAPTDLDTTLYNRQPAFSRDGSTLYYLKTSGVAGAPGDLWSVPAAGGSAAAVATTAIDEIDVAVSANPAADVTPPAAPSIDSTFTLNGTSATLRWTLPTDTDGDLSGVVISRTGRTFYVPMSSTSVVDTGLTVGAQYDYTIKAVDRSGNQSATGATRSLRAIAPGAYFGDPTSKYSTKTSFPVRFATGGNGTETYLVKYLPYGGTLKTWVEGATGATRTFGVPGNGTTVADTAALAGGNYKFAVTVTDEFGNSSAATVSPQAVVPFDQSKAIFNLSSSVASSSAFLGSYKKISSTSAYAKVTLVGDRLQVIGFKCSSCGSFAIYDGATKIGTVSTYSTTLVARTVLFTKTYTGNATHTFWIRPLGTAGHPTVALDGFAMRRK
jgi:hypothetical protein